MPKRSIFYTLLIALLVIASIIPFHLNPDAFLADDAYFYLQVADNIRLGHGSTFHEITPTNGYHPLWMLCCVAGAFLSGGNKTLLLHLMGGLQDLLFLISLFLLWKCGHRLRLSFTSLGILVLALVMTLVGGLRIFESHLSLTLQLGLLYLFLRYVDVPSIKDLALIGVTMGLCMLARLDTVFFCAMMWFALLPIILSGFSRTSSLFALTLPPCLMLIPYLAYNFSEFGHIVPISGMIKSTYPHISFSYTNLGIHGGPTVIIALCLSLCAFFSERSKENRLVFGVLVASVALHALYTGSLSTGSQWYFTTAFIAIALSLMRLVTSLWESMKTLISRLAAFFRFMCGTFTLLMFSFFLIISYLKTTYYFSIALVATGRESIIEPAEIPLAKELAEKLKNNFPAGTPIFIYDYPGMVAYYSGMRIVPLDGLMNDFLYNDQLAELGISKYAALHHIDYLIVPITLPNHKSYIRPFLTVQTDLKGKTQANFFTPLGLSNAGSLTLANNQLLFRMLNPVVPDKQDFPEIGLWNIAKDKS